MSFDDGLSTHPSAPIGDDEWSVVSVADSTGTGQDGAFTHGLSRLGLPELVLWARPSEGADPGADWLLTHDDRARQLEQWALDLIEGVLTPDDVHRQTFDHGFTTVTFRFGPPTTAAAAGVIDLPPGQPVIVVAWSLARRMPPAPRDPGSPDVRRVAGWRSRAEAMVANWRLHRAGRPVPAEVALLGRAQRFGPMSDWVSSRIDQVHAADDTVLHEFFDRIPMVALITCQHCIGESLLHLASRSGRGGPAREAINAAGLILPNWLPGSIAWQTLVDDVTQATPTIAQQEVRTLMEARLLVSLEHLLLAAVVADLAPPDLMAPACGPWEWAVHGGRVPGRAWLAPPSAREATRRLLTAADGTSTLLPALDRPYDILDPTETVEELFRLAGSSSRHGVSTAALLTAADRSAGVIGGLQTTARGSARPGWLLTPRQRAGLSRREVRHAEHLAAPLLTAVALPTHLHPDTWRLITAQLRPYVADLPEEPPDGGLLL